MTQTAASLPLSVLTSLPLPGEAAVLPAMPGADAPTIQETADFGAIMAAMPVPMTSSPAGAVPLPSTEMTMSASPVASAVTEPALPDGGKILPLSLPRASTPVLDDSQVAADPSEADGAPLAERQEPARAIPAPPERVAANVLPVLPIALAPLPATITPAPSVAEPEVPPVHPDQPGPVPVRLALQLTAEAARPRSRPGQPEALPLTHSASAQVTTEQRPPQAQRPTAPLLPQDASEQQAVQPFPAMILRLSADRTPRDDLPIVPALPTAVGAQPQPGVAVGPASPLPTPHDFAALVDRLAAAREAVQPHSISVAVRHADFGPVRIDFRHEDGTLNVALASADPDLARAIAAAPPVQTVAPSSETAQSSGRGADSRQQDGGGTSARGHGQADRRDDRAPRGNPSPHRQASHRGHDGSEIFA